MEIKGDEFIKTVKLQQEKNDIQQRLRELEELDNISNEQNSNPYQNTIPPEESELDDIMLQASDENGSNIKKKYLILGLLLVVLFLLSVIIIRFLSNQETINSNQESTITQNEEVKADNIEQEYQNIINKKLNSIKEKELTTSMDIAKMEQMEQQIPEEKAVVVVEKPKVLKKDIFEINTKKEKKVVKTIKKSNPFSKVKIKKEKLKDKTKKKSIIKKGAYIQVGSFTKEINKKYIQKLKNKRIKYILYKAIVKGKEYTKVLVGPYKNKETAKKDSVNIENKLNINSSYVLSL